MKVLVCGGRDYDDRDLVYYMLDRFNAEAPFRMIVEGAATGADTLAYDWAMSRRIPCLRVPADWHRLGKAAGMERNRKMVEMTKPDRVVAFPGGIGTNAMTDHARMMGIKVREVTGQHPRDMPEDYADRNLRLQHEENGMFTRWSVVDVNGRPVDEAPRSP
jgi:hypothetical protein